MGPEEGLGGDAKFSSDRVRWRWPGPGFQDVCLPTLSSLALRAYQKVRKHNLKYFKNSTLVSEQRFGLPPDSPD